LLHHESHNPTQQNEPGVVQIWSVDGHWSMGAAYIAEAPPATLGRFGPMHENDKFGRCYV